MIKRFVVTFIITLFVTGVFAGIGHFRGDGEVGVFGCKRIEVDIKIRIAEAKAEGIGGVYPEGIEIPVAHIDALPVEFFLQVAV